MRVPSQDRRLPIGRRPGNLLPSSPLWVERGEVPAGQFLAGNVTLDLRQKRDFVGDLAVELQARQWQSILTVVRVPELTEVDGDHVIASRVKHHLTLDAENPNSITTCLTRARENARSVSARVACHA